MEEYRIDPTIQYDVVELPSRGIHYANKKKSLRVGYLTASDENILSAQNLIQNNSVIEELLKRKILDKDFDLVFQLSCFVWNVQFDEMLKTSWKHVKPGGSLIATFRLTCGAGCDDMGKSYQYIDEKSGELAAYVVINAKVLLNKLKELLPARIIAYGYFGTPSPTAVTPYTELCFAAFAIQKKKKPNAIKPELNLDLPQKILLLDL